MANSADSETRAAVISRWGNVAPLVSKVPGGIHSGRLKPPDKAGQPQQTVAQVESKQGRGPVFSAPSAPGQAYVDFRDVSIIVRGVGEKAVGDILGLVKANFDEQPLAFAAPTTWMRTEPIEDSLEEEPGTKAGDDVWKATAKYRVWTNRVM